MVKKITRDTSIGKTKRTTDVIIAEAVARQNAWLENRRDFTTKFLRQMNWFNKKPTEIKSSKNTVTVNNDDCVKEKSSSGLSAYWFPALCVVLVLGILVFGFMPNGKESVVTKTEVVKTEKTTEITNEEAGLEFDIVRIAPDGDLVVGARWAPYKKVSLVINGEVVATELTDENGEFVYAPSEKLEPGNYTIELISANTDEKSKNKVFLYVSEQGAEKSLSLLMTEDGSTLLQSPKAEASDFVVSKIDYLESGRIVVSGKALPRLRVSMYLNKKSLGFARVSDYQNFGFGADVEKLIPGEEYKLTLRLHDGDGKAVRTFSHKFVMPAQTGADDTFYSVRQGDCLWIIARNFLRKGILFSIISDANHIENPDLIFPEQKLLIPVEK